MKKFKNENNILCDYGCGKEAEYIFKNGKVCCVYNFNKCSGYSKKLSSLRKGKTSPHKGKKRNYSKDARYRMGNSTRGKLVWNSGLKKCFNEKTLKRMSFIKIGKSYITPDGKKRLSERMKNGGSKKANDNNLNRTCTEKTKEKISKSNTGKKCPEHVKELNRQRMLNGGAAYNNSFIRNVSKPQIELFNKIKKIYPNAILNHPCHPLNFSLDVAIPELMICFESDGSWWHQDKEKDLKRQEKIEELGWRLIRYYPVDNIKQVPSIEQIKKDIENIIGGQNVRF